MQPFRIEYEYPHRRHCNLLHGPHLYHNEQPIINKFREEHREFTKKMNEKTLSRADRKELKAAGIKRRDKEAVKAYFDEKKRLAEEKQKAEAEKAEEAKRREREANPTTEDLLKQILAELKNK